MKRKILEIDNNKDISKEQILLDSFEKMLPENNVSLSDTRQIIADEEEK